MEGYIEHRILQKHLKHRLYITVRDAQNILLDRRIDRTTRRLKCQLLNINSEG